MARGLAFEDSKAVLRLGAPHFVDVTNWLEPPVFKQDGSFTVRGLKIDDGTAVLQSRGPNLTEAMKFCDPGPDLETLLQFCGSGPHI